MARPKKETNLREKAYMKFAQKRLRSIHKAVKKARLFEVRKALRRLAAASGQREAEEKLKGQVAALKALSVDGLSNRIAQQFSWPLRWQAGRLVSEQGEGDAGDADGSGGAVPTAEQWGGGEGETAAVEAAQAPAAAAEERVRRTRTVKEVVEATVAEQARRFAEASVQRVGAVESRAGEQQLEGSSDGAEDGQGSGGGGNGAAASGGRGRKESSPRQAEAKPQKKRGADAAAGKARNRLGQRARRALHEQKYGQQAKHKQLEGRKRGRGGGGEVALHPSWLAKQRQQERTRGIAIEPGAAPPAARKVVFDDDGAAAPAGSGGAADGKRAGGAGGGRNAVEAPVLHPSWEARKRAKAMQGMAAPQGKKLVFSDDDDA